VTIAPKEIETKQTMRKLVTTDKSIYPDEENTPERSLWCAVLHSFVVDIQAKRIDYLTPDDVWAIKYLCSILGLDNEIILEGIPKVKTKVKRLHHQRHKSSDIRNPPELLAAIEWVKTHPPKRGELKGIAKQFGCKYDRLYERTKCFR